MNIPVIQFFIENVREEEIRSKRVLEVGSRYVNGSVRPFIQRLHPKEYVGVDVEPGKYVDMILAAENLVEHFGSDSFDVVIATELLEHVRDWKLVVNNMKELSKRGGSVYITTRSYGFPFHGYPLDFWRYEVKDMQTIFSDFRILALQKDSHEPGVFLRAEKPDGYRPNNLEDVAIYSMIIGKRTLSVPDVHEMALLRRLKISAMRSIDRVSRPLFYSTIRRIGS